MKPCVLTKETRECRKLESVASALEAFSKHGYKYWVGDCYLDFGSGWMWTTVIRNSDFKDTNVQVLNPREWEAIMATENAADLAKVIDEIRNGEYFND